MRKKHLEPVSTGIPYSTTKLHTQTVNQTKSSSGSLGLARNLLAFECPSVGSVRVTATSARNHNTRSSSSSSLCYVFGTILRHALSPFECVERFCHFGIHKTFRFSSNSRYLAGPKSTGSAISLQNVIIRCASMVLISPNSSTLLTHLFCYHKWQCLTTNFEEALVALLPSSFSTRLPVGAHTARPSIFSDRSEIAEKVVQCYSPLGFDHFVKPMVLTVLGQLVQILVAAASKMTSASLVHERTLAPGAPASAVPRLVHR